MVNFGTEKSEFCRRFCAQVELRAVLCNALQFSHIRQMAPIVDADAKSLVSIGVSVHRAGSRWALPRYLPVVED